MPTITLTGEMTNSVVKPKTYDKDGLPKNSSFLAITLKVELSQLTELELGTLQLMLADKGEVDVVIEEKPPFQTTIPDTVPDGVEPVPDNEVPA